MQSGMRMRLWPHDAGLVVRNGVKAATERPVYARAGDRAEGYIVRIRMDKLAPKDRRLRGGIFAAEAYY